MTCSFVQEMHTNLTEEPDADKDFLGLPSIKNYTDQQGDNPISIVLEIEHKKSTVAVKNALNLLIKQEPEADIYESENVPFEAPKNVCAKYEETSLIIDNLQKLSDAGLNGYKETQNKALLKIETNQTTNDFEEMHEVSVKDGKIKNEDVDIKEDLEESETSTSSACDSQDSQCKNLKIFKSRFKCNACDFETIYKKNIKRHLLRHHNTGDVQKFKCAQCSYKTISQSDLNRHVIRHEVGAPMVQCNKCDFQTIHKRSLNHHLLQHNNPEEVEEFKCDKCSYKTNYKAYLQKHLLRHKNPEVERYKCNKCDFQTTHEGSVKSHVLRHNYPEEVRTFECDQCPYKTKLKADLKRHFFRHRVPDEAEMFKCNTCNYKTIHKSNLKAHLLRHNHLIQKSSTRRLNAISNLTKHLNPIYPDTSSNLVKIQKSKCSNAM